MVKNFTTQEAAEILGIKPSTLEVYRSTGRLALPYVKIGRKVLYPGEDLQRFMDGLKRRQSTSEKD